MCSILNGLKFFSTPEKISGPVFELISIFLKKPTNIPIQKSVPFKLVLLNNKSSTSFEYISFIGEKTKAPTFSHLVLAYTFEYPSASSTTFKQYPEL